MEFGDLAIDSKESGMCTARFINDSLDKFLWNCEFKIFQGEIWVYTTQDIDPYHELFVPYGWYYWWCRKLTLSKAVWGECARAYPEISAKLNEGHDKLDYKERKLIKSRAQPNSKKTVPLAERNNNHVDMWKSFPTNEGLEVKTRYPRRFKPKMVNKSFTNKWQRIHTAVRDTYPDMEDQVNTNCGVAKEGAVADIKVCTWNCGGCSEEKIETFCLYMDKNNIDVGFVSDIRQTAVECEHLKRKIKGMFKDDVHCSTSEVVDPGTTNGKVGGQLDIVRQLWKNYVTNV